MGTKRQLDLQEKAKAESEHLEAKPTATKKKRAKKGEDMAKCPGPSEAACREAHTLLTAEYGVRDAPKGRRDILDAVVQTILSQNTTDKQSHAAMQKLKAAYPKWTSVLHAEAGVVEEVVRSAGLADIKMARVRAILQQLIDEHHCTSKGEPSLEFLNSESDDFCKSYLGALKGVGPKTISCVLLFAMARQDFPVDTHVWKLALSLRWVPSSASREDTYQILNRCVPDDIKYGLHVLFVHHGKVLKNKLGVLSAVGKANKSMSPPKGVQGPDEVKQEANIETPAPKLKMEVATTTKGTTTVKAEVKTEKEQVQAEVKVEREQEEVPPKSSRPSPQQAKVKVEPCVKPGKGSLDVRKVIIKEEPT